MSGLSMAEWDVAQKVKAACARCGKMAFRTRMGLCRTCHGEADANYKPLNLDNDPEVNAYDRDADGGGYDDHHLWEGDESLPFEQSQQRFHGVRRDDV